MISSQNLTPLKPLKRSSSIASLIDHTLLKVDASAEEIKKLCLEAQKYAFAGVCVHSGYIRLVASLLLEFEIKPISVVGFPLGANLSAVKAFEAKEAIRAGAQEIDMVLCIGALKANDYKNVLNDIQAVVQASEPYPVKVILETSLLNEEQKKIGCILSKAAGAHFIKTSTGFSTSGATLEDIQFLRQCLGPSMGIKASGGIRTYLEAVKMLDAGATRIGTSAGVEIVEAEKEKNQA